MYSIDHELLKLFLVITTALIRVTNNKKTWLGIIKRLHCRTKISYACCYCDVWTDMHHKRWNYNHQKIQVKLDHHKCIEISISYARTDVYYKYSLFPFTYWYGTIHLRSSKTYNHLILLGLLFNCLYNYTY